MSASSVNAQFPQDLSLNQTNVVVVRVQFGHWRNLALG